MHVHIRLVLYCNDYQTVFPYIFLHIHFNHYTTETYNNYTTYIVFEARGFLLKWNHSFAVLVCRLVKFDLISTQL